MADVRTPAAAAPEGPALEYQVKAVFLLRIAQFTDWPVRMPRTEPFVIGVLGADPFGSFLDEAVAGEQITGRPVAVRRFTDPRELSRVDLLFIADSHRREAGRVLARLAGSTTLTVADFQGFVGRGGAIELFLDHGKVRFRVDRKVATAAGLELRSQLLRVAATVD